MRSSTMNAQTAQGWSSLKELDEKRKEDIARDKEQARRSRNLFSAIVIAVLDDAIRENRVRPGNGVRDIEYWARSRDGRIILTCAGINPSERVVAGLAAFVERGVKTNAALAKTNQKPKESDDDSDEL